MNHDQLQILVSSFIDNEVDEDEKLLVLEHLHKCQECRKFVDQVKQMKEAIGSIENVQLSPGFAGRVNKIITGQEDLVEQWTGIEHLARNAVFAIAVLVLALFYITRYNEESTPGISEILIDSSGRDSVATHVLLGRDELSKGDFLYAVMSK